MEDIDISDELYEAIKVYLAIKLLNDLQYPERWPNLPGFQGQDIFSSIFEISLVEKGEFDVPVDKPVVYKAQETTATPN
jgi:hypothetical protein